MKVDGIISGKIFKGTNPKKDGVTYGPNTSKIHKHPVDDILDNTLGKSNIPYEANGAVHIDPSKIEYLKS